MNDTELFELACKLDDLAAMLEEGIFNAKRVSTKLGKLADSIREKLEAPQVTP